MFVLVLNWFCFLFVEEIKFFWTVSFCFLDMLIAYLCLYLTICFLFCVCFKREVRSRWLIKFSFNRLARTSHGWYTAMVLPARKSQIFSVMFISIKIRTIWLIGYKVFSLKSVFHLRVLAAIDDIHNFIRRKLYADSILQVTFVQHMGYTYILPVHWDPLGGELSNLFRSSFCSQSLEFGCISPFVYLEGVL